VIPVSLERFSTVFAERKDKLQSLPPVDFLHKLAKEIAETCTGLIPKVGERVRSSESLFTPHSLAIDLARPGLGLGHDLVWRLTANDLRVRMQVVSGDYAKDVMAYAFSRVQTEYTSFVGLLDAASRSIKHFKGKVNGAVLPIDALVESLDRNDSLKFSGKPYEISFEVDTPIASSPQQNVSSWLKETVRCLSPLYRFIVLPWDSAIAASATEEEALGYPEGRLHYSLHRKRERNPSLIKKVKELAKEKNEGRLICAVCDFDFLKFYGERGRDFAEAHHLIPVSEMEEEHVSRPEDMVIVCSNCHRMLHRSPSISPEKLKLALSSQ
jgi:hypothetical protein